MTAPIERRGHFQSPFRAAFSDAREEPGREQEAALDLPPPFAGWCEPGEILCIRPEPCRKCSGRILVGYLLDQEGDCYGWSSARGMRQT